jgi:hypothetical protein
MQPPRGLLGPRAVWHGGFLGENAGVQLVQQRDETRSKRFREIVSFAQGFSELGSNGRGIRRLLEIVVSLLHGGTVIGRDE